jgi:hypothetical protein
MRLLWFLNAVLLTRVDAVALWTVGQEVKTTSGVVKGRFATRPGFSDVSEYVGVPYAYPPQGELRWMPPKPFESNGTIDATKWVRGFRVKCFNFTLLRCFRKSKKFYTLLTLHLWP